MSDLVLRTAVGNYGHTTPLKDGTITSPAFSMEHIEVSPVTSIFRRMVRELEFDVAEMALSTYLCARAHGKQFTGVPIFLTRAFYHGGIVVNRKSGIETPKDLEGKRFGVRSYTLTPGVWTRGLLQTEYGVDLDAVTWVLSGDEHVAEYVAPANVVSSSNSNLGEMLVSGEIDAAIGVGPVDSPDVRPLFDEPDAADAAWHRKTGVYPISHMLVVKNAALDANPRPGWRAVRDVQHGAGPLPRQAAFGRCRCARGPALPSDGRRGGRRPDPLRSGKLAEDAGDLRGLQRGAECDTGGGCGGGAVHGGDAGAGVTRNRAISTCC